jgi:hypothetical protein
MTMTSKWTASTSWRRLCSLLDVLKISFWTPKASLGPYRRKEQLELINNAQTECSSTCVCVCASACECLKRWVRRNDVAGHAEFNHACLTGGRGIATGLSTTAVLELRSDFLGTFPIHVLYKASSAIQQGTMGVTHASSL